jgi:hypothetical protein
MDWTKVVVMKAWQWMWPLALVGVAANAQAAIDEVSFLRCRPIADARARLACYDALELNAKPAFAPRNDTAPMPGETVPVPAIALFGMEHQNDQQVKEINSRIIGSFEGWGPRSKFRLENGQVWQISDDSNAVYALKSPKVRISRAVLSGFEMEIEGAKRAPRVKRLE